MRASSYRGLVFSLHMRPSYNYLLNHRLCRGYGYNNNYFRQRKPKRAALKEDYLLHCIANGRDFRKTEKNQALLNRSATDAPAVKGTASARSRKPVLLELSGFVFLEQSKKGIFGASVQGMLLCLS